MVLGLGKEIVNDPLEHLCDGVLDGGSQFTINVLPVLVQEEIRTGTESRISSVKVIQMHVHPLWVHRDFHPVSLHVFTAFVLHLPTKHLYHSPQVGHCDVGQAFALNRKHQHPSINRILSSQLHVWNEGADFTGGSVKDLRKAPGNFIEGKFLGQLNDLLRISILYGFHSGPFQAEDPQLFQLQLHVHRTLRSLDDVHFLHVDWVQGDQIRRWNSIEVLLQHVVDRSRDADGIFVVALFDIGCCCGGGIE